MPSASLNVVAGNAKLNAVPTVAVWLEIAVATIGVEFTAWSANDATSLAPALSCSLLAAGCA